MTRLRVIQHNVLAWNGRKYDLCNSYRHLDPDIILLNSHGLTDGDTLNDHMLHEPVCVRQYNKEKSFRKEELQGKHKTDLQPKCCIDYTSES